MPVCMKLGSSMHIEALVSMLGPCKQIYTGGSRRLLNRVHAAHWCVCVVYSAESYVIFTLGCVGFVKLFRGWFSFKTEHPTRGFLFCSNLSTRIWFLCASCNSPVGFGCMWALFVAPWCLCFGTSKSRLSDHGFQLWLWCVVGVGVLVCCVLVCLWL